MQSSNVGRLCITQTIDLKRTYSCQKELNIWMNEMAKKEKQSVYVSPMVKTMEIKTRAMLCQSGGINYMQKDEDGGGAFN